MGNGQGKQNLVYEGLVGFSRLVPSELWKHHDEVVEMAERAFGMSPAVDKRVAELKGATWEYEFYPAFRRLLNFLERPAAISSF